MTKTHIFRSIRSLAFAIAFIPAGIPARANTCSSFVVDAITHNSFRVRWANDDTAGSAQVQAQWSLTQSGGALTGTIYVVGDDTSDIANVPVGGVHVMTLTGLPSATTIYFAPQSMGNTSGTYCAPVVQTQATAAAVTHPVLPIAPVTFTISEPVPTGKIYIVSPSGALTCGNYPYATYYPSLTGTCSAGTSLQAAISSNASSGANQATFGDLIVIETGTSGMEQYSSASESTKLKLANAPDSVSVTALSTVGVFTCATSCGTLMAGEQIIMGAGNGYLFDGETNANLPLPYIPGYAYYVTSASLSSTTFTVSLTNGGSVVTPLTGNSFSGPPGVCFIPADVNGNVPVPAAGPIWIRTAAPDAQLPPFGVRLDPITFPAYASKTAQIQDASAANSTSQAAVLSAGGCAHDYFFTGIEWNYAPIGTVGEYDGGAYNAFVTTSPANYRFTFDRNWFHGTDYPERDYKALNDLEGHFMSVVESTFSNLNFWTPWWSSTPLELTSSSVITIPSTDSLGNAGKIWFGNGPSDNLPFAGTLTITGGTSTGSAVLEATRGGFFLTVPTGITATCTLSPCTVSTAASPAYSNNGTYYTRVAIANPSISAGSWTATNENAPPEGSMQNPGQEGAAAISITNGPGPYLIRNNYFFNDPGITFYLSGQNSSLINQDLSACTTAGLPACAFLPAPPGNMVFQRNTMYTDLVHLASTNNSLSNGRFYSMRQFWENKEGARFKIIGNTFYNTFCTNYSGRGYFISFSSLGGLSVSNSDFEVGWNTFDTGCQAFQIFSNESGSAQWAGFNSPQLQQRIWFHDDVITNVDRYGQSTPNTFPKSGTYSTPGDNGLIFSVQNGVPDITLQHIFIGPPKGNSPSLCVFVYNATEGLAVQNSFLSYSNDDGNNGCWTSGYASGANPSPSTPGGGAITGNNPYNLNWGPNVFLGGWQNSANLTEMTSANITTQAAAWSSPAGSTFAAGNSIGARAAAIGFQNYANSGGNYTLVSSSPYISGGVSRASDGLDVGPNYLAICVQQGCVQNVRVRSIDGTSAIVSFIAPDSTGCSVDVSTNGLATFTRASNTGGSRVQDVMLSSLTPSTAYTYRVNCSVQQPVGKFTTTP
jgi:hypothetical protein